MTLLRVIARSKPLYIVDDNFISRTHYTKELLEAMVPLAQAGVIPPWSAEMRAAFVQCVPNLRALTGKPGCEIRCFMCG